MVKLINEVEYKVLEPQLISLGTIESKVITFANFKGCSDLLEERKKVWKEALQQIIDKSQSLGAEYLKGGYAIYMAEPNATIQATGEAYKRK